MSGFLIFSKYDLYHDGYDFDLTPFFLSNGNIFI